jgi:uncharacterized protein (TIGR00255 family)
MTGFGKAQVKRDFGIICAEIRSFNHKFFEISQRLPANLLDFEDRIKEHIQTKIKRGRFNLVLTMMDSLGENLSNNKKEIFINKELAARYHMALSDLKKRLGLKEELSLSQIIALPNVLIFKETREDIQKIWPAIKSVIDMAMGNLIAMREKEGRYLYLDLSKHINAVERSVDKIDKFQPEAIAHFRSRLRRRIRELTKENSLDRGRLESEVAVFARNSDIEEELTRLKSHIINLKRILKEGNELGRKLDFIAQELNREINTIGSKVESFKASREVIEIKSCIDKIREQAQNIE